MYIFFIPPLVSCMCIVTTNRQTVVLENIDIGVHVYMIVSVDEGFLWMRALDFTTNQFKPS